MFNHHTGPLFQKQHKDKSGWAWTKQRTVRIKWYHFLHCAFLASHILSCCTHQPKNSSTFPPLSTCVEVGGINDQLNLWGKVMNNVYVLIIHGGQPSTYTTAPLEITGSPRQHKLSIRLQSAFAAQQAKAKLSLQNIDACKAKLLWPTGSLQCLYMTDTLWFHFQTLPAVCTIWKQVKCDFCRWKCVFLYIPLLFYPLLSGVSEDKHVGSDFSSVFHSFNYLHFPDALSFCCVCCSQPCSCSEPLPSTAGCSSGVKQTLSDLQTYTIPFHVSPVIKHKIMSVVCVFVLKHVDTAFRQEEGKQGGKQFLFLF